MIKTMERQVDVAKEDFGKDHIESSHRAAHKKLYLLFEEKCEGETTMIADTRRRNHREDSRFRMARAHDEADETREWNGKNEKAINVVRPLDQGNNMAKHDHDLLPMDGNEDRE